MCGIVGYVGNAEAAPIVLEGLSRLEYRGYDSAGIAMLTPERELTVAKDVGKLGVLRDALEGAMPRGSTGIGHTRWATHGKPTHANAHPHVDGDGDVVVIHNGIVENYRVLREELIAKGHVFVSETDTEVIPHLISDGVAGGLDLEHATRAAIARIEGAAAVLAMRRQEPGLLMAARIANAGGVVIGYGDDEMFIASDLPALLDHTQSVVFLDDGEVARVTAGGAEYTDLEGNVVTKAPQQLPLDTFTSGKGLYESFMAKEIAEQPQSLLDTLRGAVEFDPPAVTLANLNLTDEDIARFRRVVLLAMGTSYHAAMVGRTYIEQLTGLPAEIDNASEYRYRGAVVQDDTLVIALTQSGETVDTLAAMHEVKLRGATVVSICNTPGSQATRVADGYVLMHCGPEVAVASTKTFLGSITALYLLACRLGAARGHLDTATLGARLDDLARMHQVLGDTLLCEPAVEAIARRYAGSEHFLFLGRGLEYPIAMEGSLKLKEVSYVHAEGYAAGEMKHGPIALIDSRMPVVAIVLRDPHYAKMFSNIEEVRARDGIVIAVATEGDTGVAEKAQDVIYVPDAPDLLQPMAAAIPLQLLAYHIAKARGCDIDQPRNLAKTVTVE